MAISQNGGSSSTQKGCLTGQTPFFPHDHDMDPCRKNAARPRESLCGPGSFPPSSIGGLATNGQYSCASYQSNKGKAVYAIVLHGDMHGDGRRSVPVRKNTRASGTLHLGGTKDEGIQFRPSMQSYQNLESAKFRLSQDLNQAVRILP